MPKAGDILDLNLELWDGRTNVFVRATLFDASGTQYGLPVTLTSVGLGLYIDSTRTMPLTRQIKAVYEVFMDAGFTIPSPYHGNGADVFDLESPVINNPPTDVVGAVTDEQDLKGAVEEETKLIGVVIDDENFGC